MSMARYHSAEYQNLSTNKCSHYDGAAFMVKGEMICHGCIYKRIYELEEENKRLMHEINYMKSKIGDSLDEGA